MLGWNGFLLKQMEEICQNKRLSKKVFFLCFEEQIMTITLEISQKKCFAVLERK